MSTHRVKGHCLYSHWKHSSVASVGLHDQGADIVTVQIENVVWAKRSKHHTLYCPTKKKNNNNYFTTQPNSKTHLHLGSTHPHTHTLLTRVKLLYGGRNVAAAPSHPKPPARAALQMKPLTLLFKLLTFWPLLKFALTPAHVHNAPWLGPDRMPQIPGAWVYVQRVRRASRALLGRAAAAV